ncbi:hypothetical protein [Methylobacterium sp. E-045]|uniref:hypothetical protein n=1 Tax=Methylobacterium sp. E-045 TaxID=2836575 RepID=UPI001FBAAF07|nr:hypothetical protein [Methylobacterium sp. E-045]MCJ2132295.1 hypothetical protein [Methylobacterium sp. E-045]
MSEHHALPAAAACLEASAKYPALPAFTIPGQLEARAAWHRLPVETRDRIGTLAVDHAFAMFLTGDLLAPGEQVLAGDPQAQHEAGHRADETLEDLMALIEGALPELFGVQGQHPAWAISATAATTA